MEWGAKPPEYDILQKKWSGGRSPRSMTSCKKNGVGFSINIIHYIHKMVLLLKYLPLI
jgi:hypothetical protein